MFGPQTQSLLASGDHIFGLTSHLVGVVQRAGGAVIARPVPLALGVTGRPTLFIDERYRILWTVAIGGTSIGCYDTEELSTRDDQVAPGPILAAAAYLDQLWFVTDQGLYRIAPGMADAVAVSRRPDLIAIAPDPARHRVLALSATDVAAYPLRVGTVRRHSLPFQRADDIVVAAGEIWAAGHYGTDGVLFHLSPARLEATASAPGIGSAGAPRMLASYRNRFVVTGIGEDATMSCLDAANGLVLQTWPYQRGAVALDERGMLLSRGKGIELRSAGDCLAGAR